MSGCDSFDITVFTEVTREALDFVSVPSFFGGTKAAVFDVADLSVVNTKEMEELISNPPVSTDILILPQKEDRKTKFFKELQKKNLVMVFDKVTDEKKVQKLLQKKLASMNATIQQDAYDEFMARMDYFDRESSVTILHLFSEMEKLVSFSTEIVLANVIALTPDYRPGNIFLFEKIIADRKVDELHRELELLSGEKQFNLMHLLLRSFRIAYKAKLGFSKQDIGCSYIGLQKMSESFLVQGMEIITEAILKTKTEYMSKADACRLALLKIMSIPQ